MEKEVTKLSTSPSLCLCLFVMNNRLQMRARDCLVRRWDIKLLEVSTEEARSVFYQVYLKYLRKYP